MGFFQDLKEDLSQAVNELMPEELYRGENKGESEAEKTTFDTKSGEDAASGEEEPGMEPVVIDEDMLSRLVNDVLGEDDKVKEPQNEDLKRIEERIKAFGKKENARIRQLPDQTAERENRRSFEHGSEKHTMPQSEEINEGQAAGGLPENNTVSLSSGGLDGSGDGMVITGNVSSKGSANVTGTVIGDVDVLGKLSVKGTVKGNSRAAEVFAENACIIGDIRADGAVKIGPSSVVIGDIYGKSAVIAGAVQGDLDVKGPLVLDSSAIIMGNIRSKSLQINNGAVIEGMCSQCYADVDLAAFFEQYKN